MSSEKSQQLTGSGLERFSKIIFAFSALHIVLCYLYLHFWASGFGSEIRSLFSVEDVFNVSISALLPFYITQSISLYNLYGAWFEKLIFGQEFKIKDELKTKNFIRFCRTVASLLALGGVYIYWRKGEFSPGLFSFLFAWIFWSISVDLIKKYNLRWEWNFFAVILGFSVWNFYWNAYRDGFESRTLSEEKLVNRDEMVSQSHLSCPEGELILKKIAGYFLVIDKKKHRALYSVECKRLINITDVKEKIGFF